MTILRLNNNYQKIHSIELETTTSVIRLIKLINHKALSTDSSFFPHIYIIFLYRRRFKI